MTKERTVELKFTVDDAGSMKLGAIKDNIGKVSHEVSNMDRSLRLIKWDAIVNLGERAYQAAQQFYNFGKSVASSLNDIDRQSKIIGVSTDQWQKWTYAAKMSDVSTEALMTSMKFLSQNIMESKTTGSEADKMFKALGITGSNLGEVMYQLANIFSRAEEGETKIAWATKLMGRSAMEIIPYFNQGAIGIKNLGEEAEKYGYIIGKDLIDAGSRAEDSLKKFGIAMIKLKAQAAPLIETFAGILEKMMTLSIFSAEGKTKELENARKWLAYSIEQGASQKTIYDWQKKIQELSTSLYGIPYETIRGKEPLITKTKLPIIPKAAGAEKDIIQIAWDEYWKSYAIFLDNLQELRDEADAIERNQILKNIEDKERIEKESEKQLLDSLGIYLDKRIETIEEVAKIEFENMKKREELERDYQIKTLSLGNQTLEKRLGILKIEEEAAIEAANRINMSTANIVLYFAKTRGEITKEYNEWTQAGTMFAESLSSAWKTNVVNMIKGAENFGDAVKNLFAGIGDAFINVVSQMMVNWALFGSMVGLAGAQKKGVLGGLLNLFGLGGFLGFSQGGFVNGIRLLDVPKFQGGGVVSKPTLAMVGEGGGREYIIPENKMGKEGNTYIINNINAIDSRTFEEYVRRNPNAVLQVVYQNARAGGVMKEIIRGT